MVLKELLTVMILFADDNGPLFGCYGGLSTATKKPKYSLKLLFSIRIISPSKRILRNESMCYEKGLISRTLIATKRVCYL